MNYWCDFLEGENKVSVLAEVIDQKVDDYANLISLFKVIKKFHDTEGVTDTFELVGYFEDGSCHTNVHARFDLGERYYVGIDTKHELSYPTSFIPDQDGYWDFCPSVCLVNVIKLEDNRVFGFFITENFYESPLESFEDHFDNCDFSQTVLDAARCESMEYKIYPNPNNGEFVFKNDFRGSSIDMLEVFDASGRKLEVQTISQDTNRRLRFTVRTKGLHFIRFICGNNEYIEKVWVQ